MDPRAGWAGGLSRIPCLRIDEVAGDVFHSAVGPELGRHTDALLEGIRWGGAEAREVRPRAWMRRVHARGVDPD